MKTRNKNTCFQTPTLCIVVAASRRFAKLFQGASLAYGRSQRTAVQDAGSWKLHKKWLTAYKTQGVSCKQTRNRLTCFQTPTLCVVTVLFWPKNPLPATISSLYHERTTQVAPGHCGTGKCRVTRVGATGWRRPAARSKSRSPRPPTERGGRPGSHPGFPPNRTQEKRTHPRGPCKLVSGVQKRARKFFWCAVETAIFEIQTTFVEDSHHIPARARLLRSISIWCAMTMERDLKASCAFGLRALKAMQSYMFKKKYDLFTYICARVNAHTNP